MEKDQEIRALYSNWIQAWNTKNADGMKALLSKDCNMIGFDGSQMWGSDEIHKALSTIFAQYQRVFLSV